MDLMDALKKAAAGPMPTRNEVLEDVLIMQHNMYEFGVKYVQFMINPENMAEWACFAGAGELIMNLRTRLEES